MPFYVYLEAGQGLQNRLISGEVCKRFHWSEKSTFPGQSE